MRSLVHSLAVVLSLLAGGRAFASNCIESFVADCGDFKIVNTACMTYDNKGNVTGARDSMEALFNDPRLGKVIMNLDVKNDVAIYTAPVDAQTMVYVNYASRILTDIKHKATYTTYTIQNDMKSTERSCELLDTESIQ